MEIRVLLVLPLLALIPPICRRAKIAGFFFFFKLQELFWRFLRQLCVFELANADVLIATCVADVLPAHMHGSRTRNRSRTWNGLSSAGSSLRLSHTLRVTESLAL